eukprot:871313-Pelagomonas_calceolata.AAC.7
MHCMQIRTKESVRPMALDALRAVARRTHDAGVLGEQASSIRKILDGSAEGKIKVGVQRSIRLMIQLFKRRMMCKVSLNL